MITPSHIVYNWALGERLQLQKTHKIALIVGGFLPDVPTYIFFFVQTFFFGTAQSTLWNSMYFDSAWTPFITLSHSFILWPIIVLLGSVLKNKVLFWVGTGSLFHSALDFFVHHDDAYRHFWPLSDWIFMSPVSYWDSQYYGDWFSTVDSLIVLGLLVWLYSRASHTIMKRAIVGVTLLYVVLALLPYVIF